MISVSLIAYGMFNSVLANYLMYGLKSCNKRISGENDKPNKGELWRVFGVVMSSLGKYWVVEGYSMEDFGGLRKLSEA